MGAATLIALVVGFHDLGHESLWRDEAASAVLANRSMQEIFRVDPQGVYDALQGLWVSPGESEFSLRLPSVLFFAAAVPAVGVLGRRLFDARVGVVAAVLLAVNGWAVQYAQEARAYSLLMLLAVLSSVLYVRAVERGSLARWMLWAVVASFAVTIHLFALLVAAAQIVALVFLPAGAVVWRRVATALVLVAASAAGLLVILQAGGARAGVPTLTRGRVVSAVLDVAGAGNERPLSAVVLAAAAFAVATVIVAAGRSWREQGRSRGAWRTAFLVGWLAIPFVVALVVSVVEPILASRYLIVSLPALVVLVAAGVSRLRSRAVFAVALLALVVLSARGVLRWYSSEREDWRAATAFIAARADADDAVVVYPFLDYGVRHYYDRSDVPRAERPMIYRGVDPDLRQRLAGGGRVWLVVIAPQSRDLVAARAEVAPGRELGDTLEFNGLRVERYDPTP